MIMNLEQATDLFDHSPSDKACAYVLRTAMEAHRCGRIDLLEFERKIERVAEWLADE